MTARWVVDAVSAHRELNITWQPISLLFKNEPPPGSEYESAVAGSHRMLRVMEAVRAAGGDVQAFYWACATRIHHDRDRRAETSDIAEICTGLGLDPALAEAADDESWDAEIRTRMDAGLALVGEDVGTPIIALDTANGRQGIFGPVITRVPSSSEALSMWDAMVTLMGVPGFWELKRTRTEKPEFGERPS